MTTETKFGILREIVEKQTREENRKQKIQDEIKGIDSIIHKAILEEDKSIDLIKLLNRQMKLVTHRKGAGGAIRRLQAILTDVILGKGEYDIDQLTLDELMKTPTKKENKKEKINAGVKHDSIQ